MSSIQDTPVGSREGQEVVRRIIGPDVPAMSVFDAMKEIAEQAGVPFRSVNVPSRMYRSVLTNKDGRFSVVVRRRDVQRIINRISYQEAMS